MNKTELVTGAEERPHRWGPRGTAAATFAGRLTFEHVSLSFGPIPAVRDVSFDLAPGEIVCLLGPSGCGKTTLLRIAAGIERPDEGRVLIDGEEIAGPEKFVPPEKRNIGLMFQDFALFPHMSIIANVAFGLRGLSRAEALAEARLALKRVGLADYENEFSHRLSGGEQQRAALARAIVPRPQVMLMDEPFSGLDQRLRDSVRAETLALLRETRATAMLVTHDPVEALGLADRILLMRRGRLVQAGTPADIYRHPADAEAARFFCDMNEMIGRVRAGRAETPLGTFAAPGRAEGEPVLVMMRPQAFSAAPEGIGPEGFVLASRFIGDATVLSVIFKGLETPITVRLPAAVAPKQGTSLAFAIDPTQVLAFTADGSAPI
ncbi:ABC transporter ATP-binding protein [Taklimakanibacter lacteus]|uniref:ABC transporter ATP-binding protein n=1 Tax=Taklimakanibacter lacteus TaxID=2268456 RepID=UPI000E6645B7